MNAARSMPAFALCIVLVACQASTGTGGAESAPAGSSAGPLTSVVPSQPGIVLREAPADMGCDAIGWEGEPYRTLTFHVDPDSVEPVWAESNTGSMLATYWSRGFQAGTAEERVVRDPSGQVFVTDGEVVEVPQGANLYIHDYLVCLRPDRLWVLISERG